jgi:hypothetical protein
MPWLPAPAGWTFAARPSAGVAGLVPTDFLEVMPAVAKALAVPPNEGHSNRGRGESPTGAHARAQARAKTRQGSRPPPITTSDDVAERRQRQGKTTATSAGLNEEDDGAGVWGPTERSRKPPTQQLQHASAADVRLVAATASPGSKRKAPPSPPPSAPPSEPSPPASTAHAGSSVNAEQEPGQEAAMRHIQKVASQSSQSSQLQAGLRQSRISLRRDATETVHADGAEAPAARERESSLVGIVVAKDVDSGATVVADDGFAEEDWDDDEEPAEIS